MIKSAITLAISVSLLLPFGGRAHRKTEEGNRAYEQGDYEGALRAYSEAQREDPDSPELYYDQGNALYRQGDLAGAGKSYTRALLSGAPGLTSMAAYNLGNTYYEEGRYDEAVKAYRRSLMAAPDDPDAKRNLELALRALEQQEQQSGEDEEKQQGAEGEDQEEQDEQEQQQQPSPDQNASDEQQDSGEPSEPEESNQQQEQEQKQQPSSQPQQNPGEMSRDEADRLLDNLDEQERESQKRRAMREAQQESRAGRGGLVRRSLLPVCLILLSTSGVLAASDVEVRAYVRPDGPVTDTQRINLVIEAVGPSLPDVSVNSLPTFKNLTVISGPSTTHSTTFRSVGTRTEQRQTESLIFSLLPAAPGTAEIPPISVRVGDDTYVTETIRIDVTQGSTRPSTSAGDRGQATGEPPVFLEAEINNDDVWVGQAVTLDVTLYAATRVGNFSWLDQPTFTNFWVEDLEVDSVAEAYTTTVDDRRYTAYPLERKILIPTTPGKFSLTPYSAQFQVRRSSSDRRDFFSIDRFQNVVRKSEPLDVRVRALPGDAPESFTGAVGSFELDVSSDRDEAFVNDAVALKVTVEGPGFLGSAKAPVMKGSPDLKVFEPKMTQSAGFQRGRFRARKTWEWIVVPRTPGKIATPEIRFAYFDVEAGAYRELVHPSSVLLVRRGDAEGDDVVARGEVRLQRKEVAFIKPYRRPLRDRRPRVHERGWFVALLLLPLALVPAVILLSRRHARLYRNRGVARARRARTRARKNLRTTQRRSAQMDAGAFHEAVSRSLVDYVADRFDRSPTGLTYDLADELLASREIDETLRTRFRGCLEICDFARFVPASGDRERKAEVLEEALGLVDALEKELS